MNKELIINAEEQEVEIALLEEGQLLELHRDVFNKKFSVGDIYLGIVKKILYGLNAAIIDIGHSKGAFLHYNDLGFQINKILELISMNRKFFSNNFEKKENRNSIDKILHPGQRILVQISKEPISNKGPKLTSKICIPGRYLILIPFSEKISISKKIKNAKEESRLLSYIRKIKPHEFGIIIRTASHNKREEVLNEELIFLIKKWKKTLKNLIKLPPPPVRVLSEISKTSCLLRDTFNDDFKSIYCNNNFLCQEIHSYLSLIAPEKINIIKYYKGNIPIFEKYGIEKQIQIFLGRNVPLENGAYLIIEHTEALHVIDVNSGMNNHMKKNCTESERIDNILKINLLAATEIARQLRLRDMGGIIVVDFIDMSEPIQRKQLYEHLKEKMKNDRAKHKILPPNKFGLVQFTRHRVRPELKVNINNEKSKDSPIHYIHRLEFVLESIIKNKNHQKIQLHIHSFVSAYLKKGFPSIQQKWLLKYKKWIQIIPRDSFGYTEYKIFNENHEIISSSFH
ncbi:ribonuclease G [Blattabacterium sp. (Blattella germanica) str. Bge]|uniref:Rne/Rng family ribonuclease n=1 Tax=Blattabacterium sp. (Blattella germanica) TaxID=624186 RepID=UPI0001BB6255|nr:Rne/Rng family ribonuclease [Blattabacterium sp. (Blattella germanica)]ACY40543.1 ribonuclease G [Blattabacterium sp. (Blattella germanica) str. Bge]